MCRWPRKWTFLGLFSIGGIFIIIFNLNKVPIDHPMVSTEIRPEPQNLKQRIEQNNDILRKKQPNLSKWSTNDINPGVPLEYHPTNNAIEIRAEPQNSEQRIEKNNDILNKKPQNLPKWSTNDSILGATLKYHSTSNSAFEKAFKNLSLTMQRLYGNELLDTEFTPGKAISVDKVRKVLVVSGYRTGSTFLTAILSSLPWTFYSFEPLQVYVHTSFVTGGTDIQISKYIQILKDIFACNFTSLTSYLEKAKKNGFMRHNKIVMDTCPIEKKLCVNSEFFSKLCHQMPLRVQKTIRLALNVIEELLEDPTYDLRVIYLARDPRGTIHSRKQRIFCTTKNCINHQAVCDNLLSDFKTAEKFAQKYPNKFLMVRYEDVSLDPEFMTRKIFRVIGLRYHRYAEEFIKVHTNVEAIKHHFSMGPYTTFRNSKTTVFAWRNGTNFTEMDTIQKSCKEVLPKLGYRYFDNEEQYLNQSISPLTYT